MNCKLFPFQIDGAAWLSGRKFAFLADEMGLGKSAQTIIGWEKIGAKRILIICPAIARDTWESEIEKFSVSTPQVYIVKEKSDCAFIHDGPEVVICSFDFAERYGFIFTKRASWDVMVVDEAHYLKNTKAKRTKAVLGAKGIIHNVSRCWALSGTPTPNHAGELWPWLYSFGATKLKYVEFIKRYCDVFLHQYGPSQFQITEVIKGTKLDMIPELRGIMDSYFLRRRKSEVMKELPPIYFQSVVIPPGEVDFEICKNLMAAHKYPELFKQRIAAEQKFVDQVMFRHGLSPEAMKALEILAPSVSMLRRYIGLQKMPKSIELIRSELENDAYEKLVIFAIHRDVIYHTREALAKYGAVTLYGGTDPDKKIKNIMDFQTKASCRVIIAQIHAAGTNITLTSAHNVVFIEQDWVPGNNAQAAMRCHRIGQTKPVFVRFIGLDHSFDKRMAVMLAKKTAELKEIFMDTDVTPQLSFSEIKKDMDKFQKIKDERNTKARLENEFTESLIGEDNDPNYS